MQSIYVHTLAILAMIMMSLMYLGAACLDGSFDTSMQNRSPEAIQTLHTTCAKAAGRLTTQVAGEVSRPVVLVKMIPRGLQHITLSVSESSVSTTCCILLHHGL